MHSIIKPFPLVHIPIAPYISSKATHFIILPISVILGFIFPFLDALPMLFAVSKLAFIHFLGLVLIIFVIMNGTIAVRFIVA